jgi:hypothetical protein
MHIAKQDLPVAAEMPEATFRQVNWGNLTVEVGNTRQNIDGEPLFKSLPDDRCQCPHWGYVLKGTMGYKFADHVETYSAGEVYYAPPGHTPFMEEGCEYIEFSPTDEYAKTMEVVERNMKAQQ